MKIKNEALPVSCNAAKELKICAETWKFFRTSSLNELRQEFAIRPNNTAEALYQTIFVIQGRNLSLDEDISFILSQLDQNGHKIPCQLGCSACCKQAITATPFEAALISAFLIKHPALSDMFLGNYKKWNAETKEIRENFMDWARQFFSHNIDDGRYKYTDFQVTCPFLVDDMCQIYPVRPYCCRSYLAMTDLCKSPVDPDEKPGFKGVDAASYTDFKKQNNLLVEFLWNNFAIDMGNTIVHLMPDLVFRFLNGDVDDVLNYCISTNKPNKATPS